MNNQATEVEDNMPPALDDDDIKEEGMADPNFTRVAYPLPPPPLLPPTKRYIVMDGERFTRFESEFYEGTLPLIYGGNQGVAANEEQEEMGKRERSEEVMEESMEDISKATMELTEVRRTVQAAGDILANRVADFSQYDIGDVRKELIEQHLHEAIERMKEAIAHIDLGLKTVNVSVSRNEARMFERLTENEDEKVEQYLSGLLAETTISEQQQYHEQEVTKLVSSTSTTPEPGNPILTSTSD